MRPYMRHAHKESKAKEYLPYKLEIMNREQKERLHYIVPRCTVVPMQEYCLLQAVSGQHKHIGQGGTIGNAKRGSDEEWEEASPESLTPNPSLGRGDQACKELVCTLFVLPSFGGVGGGFKGWWRLPDFRRSSSGKPLGGRAHNLSAFNQNQNQNPFYD